MPERRLEIVNRAGLHARPASAFVKLAGEFEAEVTVCKDGLEVNGKSIMGVLMLAAERGTSIVVRTEGPDATDALEALTSFVSEGFEEE